MRQRNWSSVNFLDSIVAYHSQSVNQVRFDSRGIRHILWKHTSFHWSTSVILWYGSKRDNNNNNNNKMKEKECEIECTGDEWRRGAGMYPVDGREFSHKSTDYWIRGISSDGGSDPSRLPYSKPLRDLLLIGNATYAGGSQVYGTERSIQHDTWSLYICILGLWWICQGSWPP